MTPQEILTGARNAYNAVGDSFFSDSELLTLLYYAEMEFVDAGLVIERRYTTTSVADQREYDYPTNLIALKRITYDGAKLAPVDLREDDALTISNEATTESGTPLYYSIWNYTLQLRPIPDDAKTIEIYGYAEPQIPTISSTLEVPSMFHPGCQDFLLKEMAIKDGNIQVYQIYEQRWQSHKMKARKWFAKKKRTDGFAIVKNEEILTTSLLGRV